MKRQIFVVYASVVDANGSYNPLSGYPKKFDSVNYGNDIDKTQLRATGDFAECWGAMCKVDTRQQQTVMLMTSSGLVLDTRTIGAIADLPDPNPEPEPDPEPEETD